jgi:phosphoglycolate phosphatase
MTEPLRLVVFDVDGTLVDSQADIVTGMTRTFERAGHVVPSRDAILQTVGLSLPQTMQRLAPEVSEAEQSDLVSTYKATYRDLRMRAGSKASSPLYAGIDAMLRSLHQIDPLFLGVATGKSRRGLDELLDAYDMHDFFVTTQCADDHPSKPHPSMLMTALMETGVEARHAVIVGDTSYDMAMGKAASISTIGVTWGYHKRKDLVDAGVVVERVDDLLNTLTTWMETRI